jgi:hypothetical protein
MFPNHLVIHTPSEASNAGVNFMTEGISIWMLLVWGQKGLFEVIKPYIKETNIMSVII